MIWNCYHLNKWNTKFTRNQHILRFSYLFKNINKKNVIYLDNYMHLLYIKKEIQKFICMKKIFLGKMTHSPFLK
jgi:hypothetical protein